MPGTRITPALLIVAAALAAAPLRAQVAVQQWRPATEAGGFVVIEPPGAPVGYGFGAALWLQYVREPVVVPRDGGPAGVVTDQLTLDLTGSIGLFNWLALSLDLPTTVYQGANLGLERGGYAGVGDPRLLAKFVLLRPGPRTAGFGLALMPEVGLPFGDRLSLLSDRNFTFTPRAALAYQAGPVLLVSNLAYKFREGAPVGTLLVDDELLLGLGVEIPIPTLPLAATVELTGATAAARPLQDLRETSVEAFVSARARLGPVVFQPGLAIGLTPGYLVPDYRLFAAVAYAPRYQDADGDGVGDRVDACLDQREDRDGYEDADGCPDPDNDGDGVLDRVDRCPDSPGPDLQAGCP